jgi:hypothetical protein
MDSSKNISHLLLQPLLDMILFVLPDLKQENKIVSGGFSVMPPID